MSIVRIQGRNPRGEAQRRDSQEEQLVNLCGLQNYGYTVNFWNHQNGDRMRENTIYINACLSIPERHRQSRVVLIPNSDEFGNCFSERDIHLKRQIRDESVKEKYVLFALEAYPKRIKCIYSPALNSFIMPKRRWGSYNTFYLWIFNFLKREGIIKPLREPRQTTSNRIPIVKYNRNGENTTILINPTWFNVTLGCDPELEILSHDLSCVLDINRPRPYMGEQAQRDYLKSEIGIDGGSHIIELRPKPSKNAHDMTQKISTLLKQIEEPVSVIGDVYPLGCHVHFGIGRGWTPHPDLVKILDDFFGRRLIDLSGRGRSSYKRLSGYREQPHGFEYRVLPSAILATPAFFELVTGGMKHLVEFYCSGNELVYNSEPTPEDYRTYAGYTEAEANAFFDHFLSFRSLMNTENKYRLDFRECWHNACNLTTVDFEAPRRAQRQADEAQRQAERARIREEQEVAAREAEDIERQRLEEVERRRLTTIIFGDDWQTNVRDRFNERLSHLVPLRLFGLRADREAVTFGYQVDGCAEIPTEGEAWANAYGVPYFIRNGDVESWEIIDAHIQAISTAELIRRGELQPPEQTEAPAEATPTAEELTLDADIGAILETLSNSPDASEAIRALPEAIRTLEQSLGVQFTIRNPRPNGTEQQEELDLT